ncbi:MAG: type II toxin-antitoxin system death-on-curing family toxin [Pseudonocardia sp.]
MNDRAVEYLDLDDLLLIGRDAVGDDPLVRDYGLLESARARPQTTVFGADAYPDVPTKAAALLHSLARNHALVDGTKRLAWLATYVFLDINGCRVTATDDEVVAFVLAVAAGQLDDVVPIAARLREWAPGPA